MTSNSNNGQCLAGSSGRGHAGFTATELIIVIAIAAILVSVASPSFVRLLQTNRLATESTLFVGDLHYARSEAIRQGVNVTMCPSTDGARCAGGRQWEVGWLIFSDPNANRAPDTGEMLIRHQRGWQGSDTLTASDAALETLSFSRDGFLIGLPADGRFIVRTTPEVANLTRCVFVNVAGRQQIVGATPGRCP